MLLAEELIALLGFLVFLDGDQIHRAHFVEALLQRVDLFGNRVPIRSRARWRPFLPGVKTLHPCRAFVGKGDGDALAANIVQVEVIFLLDAFAQVLHGHVFLRQLDFERAALFLDIRSETPALFAQAILRESRCRLPGLLLFERELRGLGVDLFAVMPQFFDTAAGILDFGLGLRLRLTKEPSSARRCSNELVQLARCAVRQRSLLLSEGGAHLFLRGQRDFAFSQLRSWLCRVAAAKPPAARVKSATCCCRLAFASFQSAALLGQPGPLLQAFLLLRGQALDFINHGVDLLMQQALGILQCVEFAFMRGDGDFLRPQFGLRLLQAGLQARFAQLWSAPLRRLTSVTCSCSWASADCNSAI